jgi:hypothetical protein
LTIKVVKEILLEGKPQDIPSANRTSN